MHKFMLDSMELITFYNFNLKLLFRYSAFFY